MIKHRIGFFILVSFLSTRLASQECTIFAQSVDRSFLKDQSLDIQESIILDSVLISAYLLFAKDEYIPEKFSNFVNTKLQGKLDHTTFVKLSNYLINSPEALRQ